MTNIVERLRDMADQRHMDRGNDAVDDALREAAAVIERYRAALEWYAKPEIYRPHPHGPAFDRRDLSFNAISALKETAP